MYSEWLQGTTQEIADRNDGGDLLFLKIADRP